MRKKTLSDRTFWTWVTEFVHNPERNIFSTWIKGADLSCFFTELDNDQRFGDDFSMFQCLKKTMPREYYREIEYCALAFSKIFQTVFPPMAIQIEQLAYIEWLCYVEPENPEYRDHFVHMLKVAFVCEEIVSDENILDVIVEWQFDSKRHLSEWCEIEGIYPQGKEIKRDIMRNAIFLAAIFHDFGYGYKLLRGYEEKLFRLNLLGCDSIDITKERAEMLKRSLMAKFILPRHASLDNNQDLTDEQTESILIGFFRDCLPFNHSVASSLVVLKIAEDLYRSAVIHPEIYLAFQIAAESCLLHDLTQSKNYLHLRSKPTNSKHLLDFGCQKEVPAGILLILADELSIWSRPFIEFHPHKKGVRVKTAYRQDCPQAINILPNRQDGKLEISSKNDPLNKTLKSQLGKCHCFSKCLDEKHKDNILEVFGYGVEFSEW